MATRHPEQQPDEVLIGNFDWDSYMQSGWTTKRRGTVAYDVYGEKIIDHDDGFGFAPLFIKVSEAEAAGLKLKDGQIDNTGFAKFLQERCGITLPV